jgi:hypothetical protein
MATSTYVVDWFGPRVLAPPVKSAGPCDAVGKMKVVLGPMISEGLMVKVWPFEVIVVGALSAIVWPPNIMVEGPMTSIGIPPTLPVISGAAGPGIPGKAKVVLGPMIWEGLMVKVWPFEVIVVGALSAIVWPPNITVEGPMTFTGIPATSPVVLGTAGPGIPGPGIPNGVVGPGPFGIIVVGEALAMADTMAEIPITPIGIVGPAGGAGLLSSAVVRGAGLGPGFPYVGGFEKLGC